MATITIDNWRGSMTGYQNGNMTSGRSWIGTVSGQNPFLQPGTLTWNNQQVQIDAAGAVITDMILAGKERVEGNTLFVYCVGHTGRVYKIQVNDPTTYNPDYDTPVLLTTLVSGSPTFTRGASLDFYGATEKIYIGHDKGVTTIAFDGSGEAAVSGSWTQTVPRPLKQFVGKLYVGNGSNIAEIDSTGTVTSSTKLSPGFPTNTQVRDMDLNVDGTYIEIVVSRLALYNITSTTQDTTSTSNAESYIFKWNGVDTGYTASTTFPSFSLTANTLFQNHQYVFGYDQYGAAIYNPSEKILFGAEFQSPLPNAIVSSGNFLTWMTPLYFGGVLELDLMSWGSLDFEIGNPLGWWDLFFMNATLPETDIILCPFQMSVSNGGLGASSNGYTNNVFGTSKIYFSTLETSSSPTTKYRLYKWTPTASLSIPSGTPINGAVYQTQTQLFSKKVNVREVRVYGQPWKAGNSFSIDIIGSAGTAVTNGSKTFTAQNSDATAPMYVGTDYAWWTPDIAPTYAVGIAVTNLGTTNHVINKVELDITEAGK